ncbi:MAG: hypothetical protein DRI69_02225 [Bacteroidetes bacterium]|nr:MAG: hypothetical protein DRI69_02225 [Bacteroidota bacterium]
MQKRIYISIPLLLLVVGAFAQTTNPFDLKWRGTKSELVVVDSTTHDTQSIVVPMTSTPEDSAKGSLTGIAIIDSGGVSEAENMPDNALSETPINTGAPSEEHIPDGVLAAKPTDEISGPDSSRDDSVPGAPSSGATELPYLNEKAPQEVDHENVDDVEAISLSPDNTYAAPIKRHTTPVANMGMALFLILFGLALVILIWAVNINRGFLQKIYKAALNENFSTLLLREQRFASSQYLYYIVYVVFFLNGGLFLYLVSRYAIWDFGYRNTPMILFLIFLVVVYSVKHFVTRALGETFQISNEMRHYNFNVILYNILAGIALMPVNLFLAFGPVGMRMPMIYAGLAIIVFLYLMRQFRGIIMSSHLVVKNVFQFFVYLCAIEILPVLVLFKFFPN